MAPRSEPDLRVLHALRLQPVAGVTDVARRAGLDEAGAGERLDVLAGKGWVRRRDGSLPGWSLTPVGRDELHRLLADELDAAGARPVVQSVLERFRPINQRFLALCTDWQLRPVPAGQTLVVNDHRDPGYDGPIVDRLAEADAQVQPLCAELAAALDRFAPYGPRLHDALDHVRAGELEWFDRPVIDSYHTIWFELHEDLLATLGRARSDEQPA